MFSLEKVLFMYNVDERHCICAVIFIPERSIQYYDSMGSNGHAYTTGLMRYMKDDWSMKNGGELRDSEKWNIFCTVDGVT